MSNAVVLAPSILVVDARPVWRTYAAGLIRNRWPDARVSEAADAASALDEAAESEADLVIVDLPGPDGVALAKALRKSRPNAQVALLTEPGSPNKRRAAGLDGVHLFAQPLSGEVAEQLLALVGWEA
jgi:DNA-binding NarL/FixJ family response regulator